MKTKTINTVYMPVFNAAQFLNQSISSILNQTFPILNLLLSTTPLLIIPGKSSNPMPKKDKRIIAIKNKI
jgi:hypothetical protein